MQDHSSCSRELGELSYEFPLVSGWSSQLQALLCTIVLTALGLGLPIVDLSCRGKSKCMFKEKKVKEFTVLMAISLRDS